MPHIKFYNYEAWEQEDLDKKKAKEAKKRSRTKTEFNDEDELADMRRHKKQLKEQEMMKETLSLMDKDKVAEMKHQKLLEAELQAAYKRGDTDKVEQIQRRLDPELEDGGKWGKYNAPDLNLRT